MTVARTFPRPDRLTPEQLARISGRLTVARDLLGGFAAEAERTARLIAAAFGVPWRLVRPRDVHHPAPLTIDGADYARRRRARRRRTR